MRIPADLHISPATVGFLRDLGHDVIRAQEALPPTASDEAIVELGGRQRRVILTQDLDFSAIIALKGQSGPSLITLRLSSSRIKCVNEMNGRAIPWIEARLKGGFVATVTDDRIRTRPLPLG